MLTNVFTRLLTFKPQGQISNYLISFLCVGFVYCLYSLLLGSQSSYSNLLLFFYISVLISTLIGGIYSGLASIIFSLLFLLFHSFFFMRFNFTNESQIETLVYLVLSFFTSFVVTAVKNAYQFSLSILNNLQSFITILDSRGKIVDINQTALILFGLNQEEAVGKRLFQTGRWKPSLSRDKQIRRANKSALKGQASRFDMKLVSLDTQKAMHIDFSVSPLLDRQRNVINIIASGNDITARVVAEQQSRRHITHLKKVEDELQESQRRFQALLNSNIIGVAIFKFSGEILQANEAFYNLIGYSATEIKTKHVEWVNLIAPEFMGRHRKAMKELRARGESLPHEKEFVRQDGTRLPVLVGSAMVDQPEQEVIAFVLDISARKRLEKRKDEFIGLASHELKTPLTTIKVFAQLLERSLRNQDQPKNLDYLLRMNAQINRLTSLVEELLDVSKIEAGKLLLQYEVHDIAQLIKDTVAEIQAISPEHTIVLEGEIEDRVTIDPYRLKQVLINLFTNAIKYSPLSKMVIVRLSGTDHHVEVQVQDYGLGIDMIDQARIFEKFVRARGKNLHSFPGLGLGLYISKQIIERHGGKIWVKSVPSQGSTFYFQIPKVPHG